MLAILCTESGKTLCGSDGIITVDGRMKRSNQLITVRHYRNRFKKNFKWKYDTWTHCYFTPSIAQCPDPIPPSELHEL